ncbi:MAG: sialidase family protein [Thermoplasmatota archaeon]
MMHRFARPLGTLLLLFLAGCTTTPAPAPTAAPGPILHALPVVDAPRFAAPHLIDEVRAGGEPVIAVTPRGTILVASHPGFTHYHPEGTAPPAQLAQDFGGQSYLFRSTDNGTSWSPIGLPMGNGMGPRGTAFGVSDPDLTVMADGTVCLTDLEALAAASVSCSTDDGQTWLEGNPLASGQPVDRQWLASYKGDLYFTANPEGGALPDFRVSSDHGLTWTDLGNTPCNSDVVANPQNGHLFQGCNGNGMTVSDDGGHTWSPPRTVPGSDGNRSRTLSEPGLDAAGNAWTAWDDGEHRLWAAGSPDEGKTWPWVFDLTPTFRAYSQYAPHCSANATCDPPGSHVEHPLTNGTYVWPWVSAGSAGRFAVTWIGAFPAADSQTYLAGAWQVFSATIVNATSTPQIVISELTPKPMHVGPICQQGTTCEVGAAQGEPQSDRRLGDFFETTVEPGTGDLLASFTDTETHPADPIGHPMFVRQVGGMRLIAPGDLATVHPTQG